MTAVTKGSRSFLNKRMSQAGAGPLIIALILTVAASMVTVSLTIMNDFQQRAAARGAAAKFGKDASTAAVEVINGLVASTVIDGFEAKYPSSSPSNNTVYMKLNPKYEAKFGKEASATPSIGMSWSWTEGFARKSGAPNMAKLTVRNCDPRATDLTSLYNKAPVMPAACALLEANVEITDGKSGVFLELDSSCLAADAGTPASPRESILASLTAIVASLVGAAESPPTRGK